ncbi:hypothetical protein LINGRAHAP2_LOCUS15462 [Linum grandiflorum]
MGTVSKSVMAALGGIGIVHYNTTPSVEASFVRSLKSHCVPLMSSMIVFSPDSRIKKKDSKLGDYMIPDDSSLLAHLATISIRSIPTCNAAG